MRTPIEARKIFKRRHPRPKERPPFRKKMLVIMSDYWLDDWNQRHETGTSEWQWPEQK